MATDVKPPATQEQADLEEVCRLAAEGKKVTDPDLLKRIRANADRVRAEALSKFGVQDIGVQIIRELRDGE
jgi:hypothetical protein